MGRQGHRRASRPQSRTSMASPARLFWLRQVVPNSDHLPSRRRHLWTTGCVRFCAGFKTPVNGSTDKGTVDWTKQKLLTIDPGEMVFSYSIVDGNVGFNSYISTVKVLPKEEGCNIEWKYEVEPAKGWTLEDLDFFIASGLQVMAQRMEAALKVLQAAMDQ